MGEIIFLVILAILDIMYLLETFKYKIPVYDNTGGPGIYPKIILAILLAAIVIRIIKILHSKTKEHFVFKELFEKDRLFFVAAFAVYIMIMRPLGIILSTIIYMTSVSFYIASVVDGTLGTTRAIAIRIVSFCVMSILIYLFFSNVMNVALPKGIFHF